MGYPAAINLPFNGEVIRDGFTLLHPGEELEKGPGYWIIIQGGAMVVRVATVAFEGIEARPVDVQVQIANGNVVFTVVGLGDKAVAESRERVRAALIELPGAGIGDPGAAEPAVDPEATSGGG